MFFHTCKKLRWPLVTFQLFLIMPRRPPTTDRQLHLGVSWYPECWSADEWPTDIAKMKELGITLVRLFEFAWKSFEPREGHFQFDWARSILDQCHAAGIKVMLGTPSAAPPAWLSSAYPDILKVDAGKSRQHGQRKHGSHISTRYRSFCRRIVKHMAQQLGQHPAIHSWQIDNEMAGNDYSAEAVATFHHWLEQRYGSIEALNQRWGLAFWSQAYDTFEQFPCPMPSLDHLRPQNDTTPVYSLPLHAFKISNGPRLSRNKSRSLGNIIPYRSLPI